MHSPFLTLLSLSLAFVSLVSAGVHDACARTGKGCPPGTQFVHPPTRAVRNGAAVAAEALRRAINTPGCSHVWIAPGVYDFGARPLVIAKSITLIGAKISGRVHIKGAISATGGRQNRDTSVVHITDGVFKAYDIDISNVIDDGKARASAPAGAIFSELGTKMALYDCNLASNQDTYFCGGQCFGRGGSISGSVDMLYGDGHSWIQGVNIYNKRCGGAIAAWNSLGGGALVVQNAHISGASNIPVGDCFLARPWRVKSDVTYFNCYMDEIINPAGWLRWGDNAPQVTFKEQGSKGPGAQGKPSRRDTSLGRELNPRELAELKVTIFFKHDVSWIDASVAAL